MIKRCKGNQPRSVAELLDGRPLLWTVMSVNGKETTRFFVNSPENIAVFLIRFRHADWIVMRNEEAGFALSDKGCMLDRCSDNDLRMKIQHRLYPMRMGKERPGEVYAPTAEDVSEYFEKKRYRGGLRLGQSI